MQLRAELGGIAVVANPCGVGLKFEPESFVVHTQVSVAAARDDIRPDQLRILCHHANVSLRIAVIPKAINTEPTFMTIDQDQVVFQSHVGMASASTTAATEAAATTAAETAAAAKASTAATTETPEAAATAKTSTTTAAETPIVASRVETSKFSGTIIRAGTSTPRARAKLAPVYHAAAASPALRETIYVPLTEALA